MSTTRRRMLLVVAAFVAGWLCSMGLNIIMNNNHAITTPSSTSLLEHPQLRTPWWPPEKTVETKETQQDAHPAQYPHQARVKRQQETVFAEPLEAPAFAAAVLSQLPPPQEPIRVCLVTSAFSGPTPNGGVGTAFHALAMHLAQARSPDDKFTFQVTVVYAAHPWCGRGEEEEWVSYFAKRRIHFQALVTDVSNFYGPKLLVRSYKVMEFLRARDGDFDVVTFHDHMGLGYFTTQLKHQGLAFQSTFLFVQGHGTIRWADHHNYRPPRDHNTLAYYHMERKAVEYSDARVFPSRYYLDWLQGPEAEFDMSTGYNFVVKNLLYPLPHDEQPLSTHFPKHFVFFGRLEVRKGLLTFLGALAQLDAQELGHITFLGPSVNIEGRKAHEVVTERMDAMNWPEDAYTVLTDLNSEEALQYILDNDAVAVIPTLGDNSPYVVIELVSRHIPLITTTAGGGAELVSITQDMEPFVVPSDDAPALAQAMSIARERGIKNFRAAEPFSATRLTYLNLIRAFAAIKDSGAAGHSARAHSDANTQPATSSHNTHAQSAKSAATATAAAAIAAVETVTAAAAQQREADKEMRAPGFGQQQRQAADVIESNAPGVLLGITSHNRPQELERAVLSLVAQKYPPAAITIMIVDDASTDPGINVSLASIRNMLTKASIAFHIVVNKEHRFVAQTRNEILAYGANIGSDFVCFLVGRWW